MEALWGEGGREGVIFDIHVCVKPIVPWTEQEAMFLFYFTIVLDVLSFVAVSFNPSLYDFSLLKWMICLFFNTSQLAIVRLKTYS